MASSGTSIASTTFKISTLPAPQLESHGTHFGIGYNGADIESFFFHGTRDKTIHTLVMLVKIWLTSTHQTY